MMNVVISITGDLGSGKSTICEILAEKYNLKKISIGTIQRELAQKYNMSTYEFNLYTERHPEIDDEIDSNLIKLSQIKENIIIDSRMAWYFVPSSFKVYLTVDLKTAAKRIIDDERTTEKYRSIEEAVQMLKLRKTSENKRFQEKYNVDCSSLTNYDLIIDTSDYTPLKAAEKIMTAFKKGKKQFMTNERKLKFETLQLHVGQEKPDSATDARVVPIYQTTSYVFANSAQAASRFDLAEPGNIYTRIMNPTSDVFEKRMAALEGGIGALATASGAAATTMAIQNIAHFGDHIISAKTIYGGTYNLFANTFKNFGITTTFVDPDTPKNFEEAIQPNTKAIFFETLGNPNSNIINIEEIAEIAHKHKIPLLADNTFATPYLLRPIEYGADIVIHSATKFIGGHGTSIGGIIVDSGKFDWEASGKFPCLTEPEPSYHGLRFTKLAEAAAYITRARVTLLRDTGATISPFNSFIFLQGIETLSLRVERHIENTLKILDFLKGHPKVEKVNHPSLPESPYNNLYKKYFPKGAGSIFTFEIKGGAKEARAFIDKLEIFSLLANVADVKSLVIHPASTTHSQMSEEELKMSGIKPNSIRLSVGTEHIDDLIYDLEQALY